MALSTPAFKAAVESAIADVGDPYLRMILTGPTSGTKYAKFAADNFGTILHRPELRITIPELGNYALLAGLAGLTFVMLRRRRYSGAHPPHRTPASCLRSSV